MMELTLLGPGAAPAARKDRGRTKTPVGVSSCEMAMTLQAGAPDDPADMGCFLPSAQDP